MLDNRFDVCAAIAAAAIGCTLPTAATRAQNDPPPAQIRCVDLRRIDHTEVVGDQNILFHMKYRTIYQNRLPHACPALGQGRPFMYRVVSTQLCNSDTVTALEQWGFGFTPGASCALGQFTLIDTASVEALKGATKPPRP